MCFENVAQFRYLGMTITNQNLIKEEIKRKLNSGNACYHSVQDLLPFCLSKNIKIRIYKTIILPVVLYDCETWSLTLREEHRLRVFESRVLRIISGLKRGEVTGDWRSILKMIKSRSMRWAGHVPRMSERRNAYKIGGKARRKETTRKTKT
jgi:hypothetical protein